MMTNMSENVKILTDWFHFNSFAFTFLTPYNVVVKLKNTLLTKQLFSAHEVWSIHKNSVKEKICLTVCPSFPFPGGPGDPIKPGSPGGPAGPACPGLPGSP